MEIIIEYNSIWQNSFLDIECKEDVACKEKESKPYKRKFTATIKQKERVDAPITKDTIIGVLCRLLGDQRKLSVIRESGDYIFRNLEENITFSIKKRKENTFTETAFIVNKSDNRSTQSTFIGVLPDNTPLFFSDTAPQLWSVLYLSVDQLVEFILSEQEYVPDNPIDFSSPRNILSRIEKIAKLNRIHSLDKKRDDLKKDQEKLENRFSAQKEKFNKLSTPTKAKISAFEKQRKKYKQEKLLLDEIASKLEAPEEHEFDTKRKEYIEKLDNKFPGETYQSEGVINPIRLYAAALYLQAERMISAGKNLEYCVKNNGDIAIQGFSKRGFNGIRDFLNKLAGSRTMTVGTPYPLTKSDGVLEITLNFDKSLSNKIYTYMENAGVSSFYLGKKGLAYVSNIRI